MEGLKDAILRAVQAARSPGEHYIDIDIDPAGTGDTGENQFIFFMKPELTAPSVKLDLVLGYLLAKLAEFKIMIESSAVLSAGYLEKYGIVSEHYGIIDAAAREPLKTITDAMWARFEEEYGKGRAEVTVAGGVPYLAAHPELNPEDLSRQWLTRGYVRLGSGTYCQFVPEEDVYLVNGFYPRMLTHFTGEGASIVSFVVRSDTRWKSARGDLTGATAPAEAKSGSIRNDFLHRQEEFGLSEVSPNLNGIHLSAGPVEGLVELMRFSENRGLAGENGGVSRFSFGEKLENNFTDDQIRRILANSKIEVNSENTTTFDATEEMDSGDALSLLKEWIK